MSLWESLKKIAPTIVTAIGGPYAGLATSVVKAALGDEQMDDAVVEERLKRPSLEDILALKNADQQMKVKMRELDIKEDELEYADKDSARKMQIATDSIMPAVLAIALTIGFFTALWAVIFYVIPPDSKDLAMLMLGTLQTAWIGAMQFYYGTTKSSQNKTELIKDSTLLLKKAA